MYLGLGQDRTTQRYVPSVTAYGREPRRRTLHRSELAQVEDSYLPQDGPFPAGFETRHQIVFPYFGVFVYGVGHRDWTLDANRSLFISPGWESNETHPVPNSGHAAVILSPSIELLDEIVRRDGPERWRAFTKGSLPASMRLRLLVQQMLWLPRDFCDPLMGDEWTVRLMREAIGTFDWRPNHSSRLVRQSKELLHAHRGQRMSLEEIARAIGVTPVYLTQEFTRHEGVPLYRYQLRLRLTEALLELPRCEDITGLALDLGFYSHSHFTASFRNAFDLTPSEYRSSVGTQHFGTSLTGMAEARKRRAA
jgi:AraC family transcriptional regulator